LDAIFHPWALRSSFKVSSLCIWIKPVTQVTKSVEQKIEELRAKRPELPRPVPPIESPVYQNWRAEYQRWVDELDYLEKIKYVQDFKLATAKVPGPLGMQFHRKTIDQINQTTASENLEDQNQESQ